MTLSPRINASGGKSRGSSKGIGVRLATASSLTTLAFVLAGSPALAQVDSRGTAVADRARPDYDALGARVGAFTLYPSVTVAVSATDNYLARDFDKQGDVYATISPEYTIRSNWARHRVEGRAWVSQSVHAELTGDNETEFGLSANGMYDASRFAQITAGAAAEQFSENRSALGAFRNTREPVRFKIARFNIGNAQSFNRFSLNWTGSATFVNYDDVNSGSGFVFDQDFRDVRRLNGGVTAQYELRSGIGLIATAEINDSRYDFRPGQPGFDPLTDIDRKSRGYNLLAGVTFELSSLVFGSLQVGVLDRSYRDPRLRDFSGLSFNGDILWNVTPLTSVRFTASRSVEDTSSRTIAGNTRSRFGISVDHELYRYIILSGDVSYGSFKPNGPGIGGDEYGIGAGARYLIDRNWSVLGNLRYDKRSSDSQFLRYQAFSGGLSVRYAL